jgi:hypothetical protein
VEVVDAWDDAWLKIGGREGMGGRICCCFRSSLVAAPGPRRVRLQQLDVAGTGAAAHHRYRHHHEASGFIKTTKATGIVGILLHIQIALLFVLCSFSFFCSLRKLP